MCFGKHANLYQSNGYSKIDLIVHQLVSKVQELIDYKTIIVIFIIEFMIMTNLNIPAQVNQVNMLNKLEMRLVFRACFREGI